ncbi:hypothetical protein I5R69_25895 [Serratia marcescens]|nr:hypothetical protein [Serratia marcescens]
MRAAIDEIAETLETGTDGLLFTAVENAVNLEVTQTDAALAAIRNEATARALKHLCDCQLISATVAQLKADELREAK